MKCALCKAQYVGKAETAFNIKLNNHRIDANSPNLFRLIHISENWVVIQPASKIYINQTKSSS